MNPDRRLLVISHPAVLAVNQLVYADLVGRGWSVDLVVPDRWHHEYGALVPEPLAVFVDRYHRLGTAFSGRPQRHLYLARIGRFLAERQPDVVFVEQEPFSVSALQWGVAAVRAGVPFGVQAAENLDRDLPAVVLAWRGWVLRHAAFVAARSPTAAGLVRRWGARGGVRLVPHHVPGWEPRPRVPSDRFRVGYAGRLVAEKGIDVLVDAVRRLEGPTDLVVAGDGPLRHWLAGQDLGGARLRVLSGLSHRGMHEAYSEMDVLVLPSRTTPSWTEQFGRVLVEALWCGLPVVGSDSGEIPWVVRSTGGGLVVPEGDPVRLAAALDDLRCDEATRRHYATEGGRRVRETFSVEAVAGSLEESLAAAQAGADRRDRPKGSEGDRPAVTLVAHGVHDSGGMERACAELVRRAHRDYRITVVACELAPDLVPLVDRWVRIRIPRRPIPLKFALFYVAAGMALRRIDADLVHSVGAIVPNKVDLASVHFCHAGQVAATGRLSPADAPLLRRVNTAAARALALAAERWSYRPQRVRHLAVVSPGLAAEVARHFRHPAIDVVPNGVDTQRFRPDIEDRSEVRARMGAGQERVVALFVGGDWDHKGLTLAIEAVARARATGPDLQLWVVGDGDRRRFERLAPVLSGSDLVRFLGPSAEVERFYRAADIFVLPSAHETFSLVCFEAAASGLPLVIPPLYGASDLVDNGGGVFVDRTVESLSAALAELAADTELRRSLGSAARRAATAYTWDRSVASLMATYGQLRSVAGGGRQRGPGPEGRAGPAEGARAPSAPGPA